VRKVAIVSVRKESVEIKLPGKDSEKVDEMSGRTQFQRLV